MKADVVVYGLGKYYESVCSLKVEMKYNVIGHCDRDGKFADIYQDYLSPADLCNTEYEFIVITSIHYKEIVNDLVEKYGVPCEDIIIWAEEERKSDYFNQAGAKYAFGQFGEDFVISQMLKEKKIPENQANYIEIGVDEPFVGNHTYFLHLAGANGILVDANPDSINLIKAVRKRQTVLNKVISDKESKVPFYIATIPALSSLSVKNIELNRGTIERQVMLDSISINEVLAMQNKTVVLSIDVEGYDRTVLKSIDFERYQPIIICAEVGNPGQELVDYMELRGYRLVFCNYINAIWERR